ncbi:hypothetical protein CHS0354_014624 [Potamilus streckersoni]|uniref:Metallo-beta-lactamase domain-containing protein n=1 Tax=Potamilus streckersoni TaxID=2493646 RepID=A0AAE0SQM8_9BIVA|nr:hypothetical protein CHS0354_014624 [Potamilus streckersoni]
MAKVWGCLFRIGYLLYTRTRIGYYYHRRDVAKAREKYGLSSGHTVIQPAEYGSLQIIPIPMALDNYAYLIFDTQSKSAVVVDPGDPEPVENVLNEMDITPEAVLITHKHWDHSGGNSQMKNHYRGIRIYGGIRDDVPDVTHSVTDHDVLEFGRLKFHVVFTPGHTEGHVVYVLDGSPFGVPDSMFSGDHLFLSGCGRMFEMPASVMLRSIDTISQMKPDTLIWPGHEYARENLEFACHLEPNNKDAQVKHSGLQYLV